MRRICGFGALIAPLLIPLISHAHGFVGDRFFPPTATTDDPFAVDELSLTGTYVRNPSSGGDGGSDQFTGAFELDKEIIPHLAIAVSDDYSHVKPVKDRAFAGSDDLNIGFKYELWQNDQHEAIVSVGVGTDLGGTGSSNFGSESTAFTPTIYLGKGFGDLPEGLSALKPFAVTATLGQSFSTDSSDSDVFMTGVALEYSIPYLQQHVKDIGLSEPFKNMIPLIELNLATVENRGPKTTTGTINPGVLWETKDFQFAVEALVPINHDSGTHVGVTAKVQIYIDDLFPSVFGHPIFGHR